MNKQVGQTSVGVREREKGSEQHLSSVALQCRDCSLVSSSPLFLFFSLQLAFSITHGSERETKNGEGLGTPIM